MLFQILKFELQYRIKRPATYIYFAILFLTCFGAMSSDVVQIGGGAGLVKENSPSTIANMMTIISAFFMMISSAVMGVAILRDFEHKMDSLIFVNPIKKFEYLGGRFIGSFIVLLFVFSGALLGFVVAEFMPWKDADKLLPFNFWNYLQPFLYLVIPNLFFTGAVFFATGALARKQVVVYVQWIVFFILYEVSGVMFSEIDNRAIASMLDPFALSTINEATQYWTVAEQNSQTIPIEGNVLYNRLIWIAVGFIALLVSYVGFSTNVVRNVVFRRKRTITEEERKKYQLDIPQVQQVFGVGTFLKQLFRQSWFYTKEVFKGIPFWAISAFGIFLLVVNSFYIGRVFGVYTYPTTYSILNQISTFNLFFLIIIVVYSGELIWKERDVKINLIYDAMPVKDSTNLLSKFIGLITVFVFVLVGLILTGVLIQAGKGYFKFELGLYFTTLFSDTFIFLILFTLLAFFVQVMVNNKFLGYAIMVLFFIATLVLSTLGVEHPMFRFASGSLGPYSDMNGFGHFVPSFSWFSLYWLGLAAFLFAVAVTLSVRGSEAIMKTRLKVGKLRLTKPMLSMLILSFLVFGLSGCYIYYNTNMVNEFENSDAQEELRANYEKTLKQYEFINQPKIVDVFLDVELYPKTRDYVANGYYWLKNVSDEAISDIHLQLNNNNPLKTDSIVFSGGATLKEAFEEFDYQIYTLNNALQPDDSVKMNFKTSFITEGFVAGGSNNTVVFNGSFFNSSQFPSFGYNEGFELVTDSDRKEYDLEPKERSMDRDNPIGLKMGVFGDDSRGINFEIKIGTDSSQIAIAPGYLQEKSIEGDRAYYHYKMDVRMENFYNIVSADYEVVRDEMTIPIDSAEEKNISLEIYYHKGHEYNLERMMKSMKKSFTYFSDRFSPYQYRQMRIMEFPRYSSFAQSFANTVPFSEGIGFMLEIKDEDDVDVAFYVTSHELAHQWWGHQVIPANVKGASMIVETLAQYSALMVMKQNYSMENMQEFLKEEMNRYLTGRASEQKKELPIALVENQQYIHYGKGAVNMFALQDYIGEDSVNAALSRFVYDWRSFKTNGRYATTKDLIGYFRNVAPDSMQSVITDLFEKIVLFENKTEEVIATQLPDSTWQVNIAINAKKLEADTLGVEQEVAINDWVDIGVYGKDEEGEDKLLYIQKHLINTEADTIQVVVPSEPTRAGIDPINKLIDRNPNDNVKWAEKEALQ